MEIIGKSKKFLGRNAVAIQFPVGKSLVFPSDISSRHTDIGQVRTGFAAHQWVLPTTNSWNPALPHQSVAPFTPPLVRVIFNPVCFPQTHLGRDRGDGEPHHTAHKLFNLSQGGHLIDVGEQDQIFLVSITDDLKEGVSGMSLNCPAFPPCEK